MNREDIVRLVQANQARLRELGVASLHLFGSAARDEAGPSSDVDMLAEFEVPSTFDRYMDLKFFLEDLIGRPVDLVTKAALKARSRGTIEREAVRIS